MRDTNNCPARLAGNRSGEGVSQRNRRCARSFAARYFKYGSGGHCYKSNPVHSQVTDGWPARLPNPPPRGPLAQPSGKIRWRISSRAIA